MKKSFENIKKQVGRLFPKPQDWSKRRKLVTVLSTVFVFSLLLGGVAWTSHASNVRSRQLAEQQEEKAQLAQQKQEALEKEESEKEQKDQKVKEGEVAKPQSETKKEEKKYATSSDPRSTAYSTTPPPPAPNSFNTKITHSGQLAYGAMMYYNATKGEKGYYGGDLVLSPASVTISRSGSDSASVTVSSRSGKAMSMPSKPWDEQNPHFFIASSSGGSGASSYNMFVDTYNMPAPGTYQLHIRATCYDFGSDGCEAHGFINVHVVD